MLRAWEGHRENMSVILMKERGGSTWGQDEKVLAKSRQTQEGP